MGGEEEEEERKKERGERKRRRGVVDGWKDGKRSSGSRKCVYGLP